MDTRIACRHPGGAVVAAALIAATSPAGADQPAGDIDALTRQLEAESRKLDALRDSLEEKQRALEEQRRALQKLERDLKRAAPATQKPLPEGAQQEVRGGQAQGQSQAQPPAPKQGQPSAASPATVGQAPEEANRPPEVAPLGRQAGVLTPYKAFIFEPSLQYSHSTNTRVAVVGFSIIPAVVIGLIDIRTVNRSAWVGTLTGRYGLTDRMEVEMRVPYVYRNDSTVARPFNDPSATDSIFNATGQGIGDVEVAARYQLNEGGADKPYFIGGLRFKSRTGRDPFEVQRVSPFAGADQLESELPTGSGFNSLQPSITMLFPSDPAVFFGGLLYVHNFTRDVGGNFGKIDPGDITQFNFGMGLALNERASFSMAYDHAILQKPKQNGITPPLAQTVQLGQLLFGYSYKLSSRTTLSVSLAVGVTQDAPDVQLTVRLPIRAF
jgi:hypothetical protein